MEPPAAAPGSAWLDVKPLTPKIDSLQDVQPSSGVLARCTGAIVRAVPSFDQPATFLSWRVEPDHVALVAKDDGERSAVLAQLRWQGAALEWNWARASSTTFAKALLEAERALPWVTIRVSLEGDATVLLTAPPVVVRKKLSPAAPVVTLVPGAPGRTFTLHAAESTDWTAAPSNAGGLVFTCSVGSVTAALDQPGRIRVEIVPPGGLAIADIRKRISERTQELRRASPDEKRIIEGEIDDLRSTLATLEQEARAPRPAWPALPVLQVRDAQGRTYAILELQPT
jgi:hypothetical protein